MKTLGILCLIVAAALCSSCYEYENPLDPDNPNNRLSTPSFNPPGGTYTSAQSVSISCATGGATIRYTTNGSEPTETSSLYSSPISITGTTTVIAKAFKSGYNPSQTASSTYTINLPYVATPSFNPPGGTYTSVQSVSISCSTSGASIRYTTNGSEPTETSSLYSSPISITGTSTVIAKAFKSGYNPSQTASSTYTINLPYVETPSFNPPGGTYTSAQSVSISCSTSGASIRYTTNGSEPTETSSLYSSPISITGTTTVNARAFKTGYNPSTIATSIYSIVPPPLTVLYPNGGEIFHRGQTYTVTWLPGPNATTVDVQVYKGSQLWLAIQNYATNDGNINWTVSYAMPDGNDYRIKVCNSDHIAHADDYDFSNGYFSILAK